MVQDRVAGLLNWHSRGGRRRLAVESGEADKLLRVTSLTLSSRLALDTATHDATTDALTGVFNRRFMDGFLDKQMRGAARLRRPLAFLLMDLDRFKAFNDTHGHPAGDVLLRSFARVMASCVRDGDLAARYGGEEFAVILPDADLAEAGEIAERIRSSAEAMKVPELPHLKPPVATVSIGLAVAPSNGRTPAELIASADGALYRSKEGGRNRVTPAG
jgi:diguanylate cyclase (GGDEF)-like protein